MGVILALVSTVPAEASLTRTESTCSGRVSKAAQRLAATVLRELGQCRTDRVIGTSRAVCPGPKARDKIEDAANRVKVIAEATCGSTCTVSGLACLTDQACPPFFETGESCGGADGRPRFDLARLGFPGPYCELQLGQPVSTAGDVATCVSELVTDTSTLAVDGVLGALPDDAGLSVDAAVCLKAAVAGTSKLTRTIFRAAAQCRDSVNRGKKSLNALTCVDDLPRLAAKVAKAEAVFREKLAPRCSSDAVLELDLCSTGIGSVSSTAVAADCLVDLAHEVADGSEPPVMRRASLVSLAEAAYPPKPRCGDSIVNQLPNPFLPLGEECDGTDDDACPGRCFPPGDLFECTCGGIPRVRFFASSSTSETDAGWTGVAHNQRTADLSGFVVNLQNCNCSSFADATCVGETTDPVCDLSGSTMPRCSHSPRSPLRCDALGDGDTVDEDADCYICDGYSQNAGAPCTNELDCVSRCYDTNDVPTGACASQADCQPSETCRGRCDTSQYCIRVPNGGPLPVNTSGVPVCGVQTYRTDVSGTLNVVTGAHAIYYRIFSQIHTGEDINRPCPVCGGFCVGGEQDRQVCSGTCAESGSACRFDEECPLGDRCTAASPDCPKGFCELSLVCGANRAVNGDVDGKACRVTADDPVFGTVSNDCLPAPSSNTTGRGLEIDYLPWTSGTRTLPASVPCTASGFELYECPCPDDGGQPSKPNACTPACNAPGSSFATGCADGNSAGVGTTCAGGENDGRLCDEDVDCPLGSCSRNPSHCVGDPAFERYSCASNADCGNGTCVDACPGGRCVPLCVVSSSDSYDGECAAGPFAYHCDGARFLYKSCNAATVGAGCDSVCSGSFSPCVDAFDCPEGQTCNGLCGSARDCAAGADGVNGTSDDIPGAGQCVQQTRSCFLDPILAEGGSTQNGRGDPTNMSTVGLFCQKASAVNIGANIGAGFGGPTRVRVHGVNVPNFTSIP